MSYNEHMNQFSNWTQAWIFYITSSLLFSAIILRSLIDYQNNPSLGLMLGVLTGWLTLFVLGTKLKIDRQGYLPLYFISQSLLILVLLFITNGKDYFAALYGILSMQVMQSTSPKTGTVWIGLFAVLMALPLARAYGIFGGIAYVFIYTFGGSLLASYTLTTRRAQESRDYNQTLMHQQQSANQQLQEYAKQIQGLAVMRERHHLARELHDSVTQSIFTMTLATQSALLLMDRDFGRVAEQLNRLSQLTQVAIAEMQMLISELQPTKNTRRELATNLRHHIANSRLLENLSVSFDVEGNLSLEPFEEQMLFRIAQEALNNVVKHTTSKQAKIRLHLIEPLWMEISDQGQGFDIQRALTGDGVGLSGMSERAADIGWSLQILTSPEAGTRIRIEKP